MKLRTVERMERAFRCYLYWRSISNYIRVQRRDEPWNEVYHQRYVSCLNRAEVCYRYLTNQACKNGR